MIRFDGVTIEPIGLADSVCPSCSATLSRFPQRKVLCEQCGAAIYSRVQPYDGKKRLLNEAMLLELDRQWQAYSELKRRVGVSTQSLGMRAMYQSLCDGKRGETIIDWDLINRWYALDRDWSKPWTD